MTADNAAPTLVSIAADTNKLVLTYNESLNTASGFVPTASDFSLTGFGAGVSVSSVSVSGSKVNLTLAGKTFAVGETLTGLSVVYTNTGNDTTDIQDNYGNEVAGFTQVVTTNATLPAPVVGAASLATITNLDVRSNLVLTVDKGVTPVAGKYITIVSDAGSVDQNDGTLLKNGYLTEHDFHDIKINVATGQTVLNTYAGVAETDAQGNLTGLYTKSAAVTWSKTLSVSSTLTASADGAGTIVIDPSMDLDLSNNYHIEVDAGAFVDSGGAGNAAITSGTFGTVTPAATNLLNNLANKSGATSVTMNNAGATAKSYNWVDLHGRGDLTDSDVAAADIFDAAATSNALTGSNSKYAFVFADITNEPGFQSVNFDVRIFNFGTNDLIYIDSQSQDNYSIAAKTDVGIVGAVGIDGSVASNVDGYPLPELAASWNQVNDAVKVATTGTAAQIGIGSLTGGTARTGSYFAIAAAGDGYPIAGSTGGQIAVTLEKAGDPAGSYAADYADFNKILNGGTDVTIPAGSNLLDPNNHNTWIVLG